VGRASHGQLIGTPITLALVAQDAGHLAVPVHRPFTLGTLRLELIPSGRCLGAAALHVDAGTGTVLYAGAIRTVAERDAAEVRSCDALVIAAPYGEAHHRFARLEDIATQTIAWVRRQLAGHRTPVLVVDTPLDGIEVAQRLAAEDLVIAGSRSIRDTLLRIASLAPSMRGLQIRTPGGREPTVIIRVEGDRIKLPEIVRTSVALVSGRALDLVQHGYENGFPWPFVAGRDELLGWIEQARAKEVFVTGACAEQIVAKLGSRARVLGPPRQMALFAP